MQRISSNIYTFMYDVNIENQYNNYRICDTCADRAAMMRGRNLGRGTISVGARLRSPTDP